MSMDYTSSKQCFTRGYKLMHAAVTTILSHRIHVDGDKGYKWIQLVSGLHALGVNVSLHMRHIIVRRQIQQPAQNTFIFKLGLVYSVII